MTKSLENQGRRRPGPPGLVGTDLPCIRCWYNLRTLPLDGRCPECGHEVQDSFYQAIYQGSVPHLKRRISSVRILCAYPIIVPLIALVAWGLATLSGRGQGVGSLVGSAVVVGGFFHYLVAILRFAAEPSEDITQHRCRAARVLPWAVLAELAVAFTGYQFLTFERFVPAAFGAIVLLVIWQAATAEREAGVWGLARTGRMARVAAVFGLAGLVMGPFLIVLSNDRVEIGVEALIGPQALDLVMTLLAVLLAACLIGSLLLVQWAMGLIMRRLQRALRQTLALDKEEIWGSIHKHELGILHRIEPLLAEESSRTPSVDKCDSGICGESMRRP